MKKSVMFFVCLTIIVLVLFLVYDYQTKTLQTVISNTQIELNFIQKFDHFKNISYGFDNNAITSRNSKIKRKHHVPKFMLDLYEKSKSIPYEEYIKMKRPVADVVKSVIPKNAGSVYERKIESGQTLEKSHLLIFDVPFPNKDEIFLTAELRILTLVQLEPNTLSGIERVIELSLYDDINQKIINLDHKHIYHTNNTWMSFNMTSVIKKAVTRKTATLKLIVTLQSYFSVLKDNKGKLEISVLPISEEYYLEHDYPVLLLSYSSSKLSKYHSRIYKNLKVDAKMLPYFNRSKTKRFKRNIDEIAEEFEEETNNVWDDDKVISRSNTKKNRRIRNSCRKKTLYVDFAEINYDSWIVQPSGYEAYQCAGKCFYPVAEHLSPTKHAIVQALMHSVAPHKAVRSCCVPTKLTSISVLYIDSKGVLTYRLGYQDMVVAECGCR